MPKNGSISNRSDASSARSLLGDTSRSHESKHSEKSEGSSKPAEKDPLRYLNEAHFLEAMEGFNKYDPEEWLPTLTVDMSEFMRGPFIVVTVVTMACTILTVVVPATLPLFSLQSDAHVVLGEDPVAGGFHRIGRDGVLDDHEQGDRAEREHQGKRDREAERAADEQPRGSHRADSPRRGSCGSARGRTPCPPWPATGSYGFRSGSGPGRNGRTRHSRAASIA